MNLKNMKCIVFILAFAMLTLIFNTEYICSNNNNTSNHNENNFNKYYLAQEIINIIEERTDKEYNNFLSHRFNNKIISNSFDKYIASNISNSSNVYKLKCRAVLNEIFYTNNDSVFVVLYIHKKDGEKHFYC